MAKGFVNLNRFKHGRAIKRDSKRKVDLQSKGKTRGKKAMDRKKKIAALIHVIC